MNTLERDGNGIPIHPSHWVDVPDPEPEGLERALIDMFVANEFDAETATALTAEVMGVLTDGKYENSPGELAKKPDGTWVCFQTEDDHYAFDPTRWKASE